MEKTISAKICEFRKARSLTQEQLGAKLGISGQAVSKWEKGESMPDIMLLPDLCDILGVSIDTLLEVPVSLKNKNIMQDFCAYAREKGGSATLIDALSRLYNDSGANSAGRNVDFGPDRIKVYDGRGMGFVISGDKYQKACLSAGNEDVAFFLRVLVDEGCLSVIKAISINNAMTEKEITKVTRMDSDVVERILIGLMKRNIICCDVDDKGKRGYLQSRNMIDVYMVLAGCVATCCGGELNGNLWFTRSNNE